MREREREMVTNTDSTQLMRNIVKPLVQKLPEVARTTFEKNSIDGHHSCDFCLGFYFKISDNITLAVIGKTSFNYYNYS